MSIPHPLIREIIDEIQYNAVSNKHKVHAIQNTLKIIDKYESKNVCELLTHLETYYETEKMTVEEYFKAYLSVVENTIFYKKYIKEMNKKQQFKKDKK